METCVWFIFLIVTLYATFSVFYETVRFKNFINPAAIAWVPVLSFLWFFLLIWSPF